MIFVILGSQKFQFNRLLEAIDNLINKGVIMDTVFAQSGYSDYIPKHYKFKRFLDREEFSMMEAQADIIITHGGTGTIVSALKKGKKVIAVPRLAKYGEHVDDHQLQLIEQFKNQNLIYGVNSCEELGNALHFIDGHNFESYQSNTQMIIDNIEKYILSLNELI